MCRACRFSLLVYLSLSPLGILSSSLKKFCPTPAQEPAFTRTTWRFLCQLDLACELRRQSRAIQLSADFPPDWGETTYNLRISAIAFNTSEEWADRLHPGLPIFVQTVTVL